ncbi:hypothetical protein C8J55DRAFT_524488 [Lentinula edodes]|uniref:Uncharacterized protein n=1 Tax=Lentinula lateritia TaxID=40482 RepID=A0A9W8ZV18_9AGAR|nr:hypothetical protein C8J55DRAFT_525619 [Lentinula edodes]KAJ4468601.1 hypothetical protein C8J55DRAFT_524488 [Lentinula edodes]
MYYTVEHCPHTPSEPLLITAQRITSATVTPVLLHRTACPLYPSVALAPSCCCDVCLDPYSWQGDHMCGRRNTGLS